MIINANSSSVLHIGRVGENNATKIVFDISKWVEEYGEGKVTLVIEQNGVISLIGTTDPALQFESNKVTWLVSNAFTKMENRGKCELYYSIDNVKVKSVLFDIVVTKSLDGYEEVTPTPYDGWINQLLDAAGEVSGAIEYAERAEEAAKKAEEVSINPPYIGVNGNWFVFDNATKSYKDSGVDASITVDIADVTMLPYGSTAYITNSGTATDPIFHLFIPNAKNGNDGHTPVKGVDYFDGNDGYSPTVSISEISGGNRVTVTDKSGSKNFDVMDGDSITSIVRTSGTGAAGTVDTYTVTTSSGGTYTFAVRNGADGKGSGDMMKSVYDPTNKAQDVFDYIDKAISGVTVTTDAYPTQGSANPVQSGGVHAALANKLDKAGDGSNVTAAFTTVSSRANIATGEKLSILFGKIAKWFSDLGSLAFKSTVVKADLANDVQMSLGKADSALQSYIETDPTVPAWAKADKKPIYTASEVGAVPTSRTINGKALSANITLAASDVGAATMNEVNIAIQTAIGNAIGGSY